MYCTKTRLLSFCFFFVLVFSLAVPAVAVERPISDETVYASRYFVTHNSSMTALGSGRINIRYSISATGSMTKLGPSTITIYKENSPGNFIRVFGYSGGMMNNNVSYTADSKTYQGVPGKRYYAEIQYYAENAGGSETWTVKTSIIRAS